MSINKLYISAVKGGREEENRLFQALAVRFRVFTSQRIQNELDIEEIVQETLMTINRYYKTTEITTSFQAWAYKILNRQIYGFINKKKTETSRENRIKKKMINVAPPDNINLDELYKRLLICLKKICQSNLRFARILNLHYHGYQTEEICEKMNITATNFYTILKRARSLMEFCLDKGDVE